MFLSSFLQVFYDMGFVLWLVLGFFLIGFASFAGIFFNLHLSVLWFLFSNIFFE